VREPEGVRASIAVTGQFAALDPALSGRGNLRLFGRLLGLGRRAARARADELLGRFDLEDAADKAVKDYSGGLRRRLDLAVSLVVERPVLILDEPTTGLDPRSRRAVWETVASERERGTGILLTTQYLEEADELADRVVVIDHGRVIREGTPSELKEAVGGAVCEIRVEDPGARERARDALGEPAGDGQVLTVAADTPRALADIVMTLERAHVAPDDVRLRRPSLDEVFLAVTGHEAVDAPEEVHA
jgi:ABC-type multidrug transport system ATPase subunit